MAQNYLSKSINLIAVENKLNVNYIKKALKKIGKSLKILYPKYNIV